MKQTAKCPKCAGERIMHLDHVADAGEWVGSGGGPMTDRSGTQPVARQVLTVRTKRAGLFGGSSEDEVLGGETEAYVCADCGYLEEYLRDPRRIPWDRVVGARPHTVKGGGTPFR